MLTPPYTPAPRPYPLPVVHVPAVCVSSNERLSILAPGYSINAAGITLSGTSQATPFVAGALAVLRHRFPGLSAAQLVAQLTSRGTPVSHESLIEGAHPWRRQRAAASSWVGGLRSDSAAAALNTKAAS